MGLSGDGRQSLLFDQIHEFDKADRGNVDRIETSLHLGPGRYAIGISTNEGVRVQGFHANHIMIVLDEVPVGFTGDLRSNRRHSGWWRCKGSSSREYCDLERSFLRRFHHESRRLESHQHFRLRHAEPPGVDARILVEAFH